MAHLTQVVTSPDEMLVLAKALGQIIPAGQVIALSGELGAGKTLFVRGLANGLGVPPTVRVTSPTFTLINEYVGGRLPLIHVDLYRLDREEELLQLGFEELLYSGAVCAVEWFTKFPQCVPSDAIEICIGIIAAENREINATAHGKRSAQLMQDWRSAISR